MEVKKRKLRKAGKESLCEYSDERETGIECQNEQETKLSRKGKRENMVWESWREGRDRLCVVSKMAWAGASRQREYGRGGCGLKGKHTFGEGGKGEPGRGSLERGRDGERQGTAQVEGVKAIITLLFVVHTAGTE